MDTNTKTKARFHLPGLFEFYTFYREFLPLFREHREYFYPWVEISSIYGAPADCLWGGGRVGFGEEKPENVLALLADFGISGRLTFSNSLLEPEHLKDRQCNRLCGLFEKQGGGVILHSELLLEYLRRAYPGLYFVSSTTKVLTEFDDFRRELDRPEFRYTVPDFRLNHHPGLETLEGWEKDRAEFLCNECCWVGCRDRKACYEAVSRKALGVDGPEYVCRSPGGREGYRFSAAMRSPAFIGVQNIRDWYLPRGFSNFKIEGRGLGSALILEFLLHYLVKPECQLEVREHIYLDSTLDLF